MYINDVSVLSIRRRRGVAYVYLAAAGDCGIGMAWRHGAARITMAAVFGIACRLMAAHRIDHQCRGRLARGGSVNVRRGPISCLAGPAHLACAQI